MAATRILLVLLLELAFYCLLGGALYRWAGVPAIAVIAMVLALPFALRIALVLATFAAAKFIGRTYPPLPLGDHLAMLGKEILSFLRFQYLILSEPLRTAEPHPSAPHGGSPDKPLIVLVHGIYCSRAVWRPIMRELRERTGCEVLAPSLGPVAADLGVQAQCLSRWLDENCAGRRIIIVAHSMGGLVTRLYLARKLGHAQIHKLICLATPHHGSAIARALHTPIGRDLCPASDMCRELERSASAIAIPIVCLLSEHDNLVIPSASCRLAGTRNFSLQGIGHMTLIYSRQTMELLVSETGA